MTQPKWTGFGVVLLAITALATLARCDKNSPTEPTVTPPSPSQLATLSWTISDSCSDGRGLQVRFFDKTNGLVWPDAGHVYVVSAGGTSTFSLAVRRGANICYGAQTDPPTGSYWGAGIDGRFGCDGCCQTGGDYTASRSLICATAQTVPGGASRTQP